MRRANTELRNNTRWSEKTETKHTINNTNMSETQSSFDANETVRLTKGICRVLHTPTIVDGKVSSTGKSIYISDEGHRLQGDDLERLLDGRIVIRGSFKYQLYTPDRHRSEQQMNKTEPQQRGNDVVHAVEELPEATHKPK